VVAYVEEDAKKALADAQDLLHEARDIALARSRSLSLARQFISKASAITTADGYVDDPSSPATSCFASSK
jgi:hypothetical protein